MPATTTHYQFTGLRKLVTPCMQANPGRMRPTNMTKGPQEGSGLRGLREIRCSQLPHLSTGGRERRRQACLHCRTLLPLWERGS